MIQFGENIAWFLPLLLICGAGSAFLYFYNPDGYSQKTRIGLAIVRFVTLFLIGLFLLDPLIKYSSNEEEKPIFVVGCDKSESIIANSDSAEVKQLIQDVESKLQALENVELKIVEFGENVEESNEFIKKGTNLSAYLKYIDENFSFRNVAGHLLLTDGIITSGLDPDYLDLKMKTPIDIVALGDTAKRPDHKILDTRYNKIVYLGNKYPVQVSIHANFLKGSSSILKVTSSSGEQFIKEHKYSLDNEVLKFDFEFEAKKVGLQVISIQLNELGVESNIVNNRVSIPIEVLDAKEQIALIYHTLSPDIGAIQKVVSKNENLNLDLIQSADLSSEAVNNLKNNYNGLILYQIPSSAIQLNAVILNTLFTSELPTMHILGKNVNMNQFETLNGSVSIKGSSSGSFNSTAAGLNSNFSLFNLPQESATILNEYPPLQAPFGEYTFKGKSSTVLYQKIGNVLSDIPLWTFVEFNGRNSVYVLGEGFWKWPLAEYRKSGNTELFTNLIESSIAYLSVKKDKSRLRVTAKSNYSNSDGVVLNAELYNELYEPINDPNIELKLVRNDSLNYDYRFDRNDLGYSLNLGVLEPGIYSYVAKTTISGVDLAKTGQFSVSELNIELSNLEANHKMLYKLANKSGGQFYLPKDLEVWSSKISNQKFSSILYNQINFKDLIDLKWFFVLIVFLLGIEWLVRKREGFL